MKEDVTKSAEQNSTETVTQNNEELKFVFARSER